jgi:hypothetical protein
MAIAKTRAVALVGVDGHLVTVEAAITCGVPGLHLVGLPDTALSEARDRVRAAILNAGENWPNRHTTVSLSPASLPKRGSSFDLSIAVSILAAAGAVPPAECADLVMIGELGLDGRVRGVPGVLPALLGVAEAGYTTVVVPRSNAAEAELVPGLSVIVVSTLRGLLCRLRDEPPPGIEEGDGASPTAGGHWRSAPLAVTTCGWRDRPAAGRPCSPSGFPHCYPRWNVRRHWRRPQFTRWRARCQRASRSSTEHRSTRRTTPPAGRPWSAAAAAG